MPCLICRYFQPIEPPEHRVQREARACEHNCGNKWDQHTAIRYYRNHQQHLQGFCHLHPTAVKVSSGYVCAQIAPPEYFFNPHWALERLEPNDNLYEWTAKALGVLLHGHWADAQNNRLADENRKLREQLKIARKRSAARLARLQKTSKEPEGEPAPTYPRLVAAE